MPSVLRMNRFSEPLAAFDSDHGSIPDHGRCALRQK